jgi:hypothetical protein
MNLSIQIDQHVAQLVRYIESLLPVLKAYIAVRSPKSCLVAFRPINPGN